MAYSNPWHLIANHAGNVTACGRKVSRHMRTTGANAWQMHEGTRCKQCAFFFDWHAKTGAK